MFGSKRNKKEKRPDGKLAENPYTNALKRMADAGAQSYVPEEEENAPLVLDFKGIENNNKKESEYKNVLKQINKKFKRGVEITEDKKLFTLSLSGKTKEGVLEWLETREAEKHPCYKILNQAVNAGATAEIDENGVLQLNFNSIESDTKRSGLFSLAKEKFNEHYGDSAKTNGKPNVLFLSGNAKEEVETGLALNGIDLSNTLEEIDWHAQTQPHKRVFSPTNRVNTVKLEKSLKEKPAEGVSAPEFLTKLYEASTAKDNTDISLEDAKAQLRTLQEQIIYFVKPENKNLPSAKKVRVEDALMIQLRTCPDADRLQLVQSLGLSSIKENMQPVHTLSTNEDNTGFTMSYTRPTHKSEEAWEKGMEAIADFTHTLENAHTISAETAYDALTDLRQQLKARNEQPIVETPSKPAPLEKPADEKPAIEETYKQQRTRLRLEKLEAGKKAAEAANESPDKKRADILNACPESELAATTQNLAKEIIKQVPKKSSINITPIALEDGFNIALYKLPGESYGDWRNRTAALSDLVSAMVPEASQTIGDSGRITVKLPQGTTSYDTLMQVTKSCQQGLTV